MTDKTEQIAALIDEELSALEKQAVALADQYWQNTGQYDPSVSKPQTEPKCRVSPSLIPVPLYVRPQH